MADENIPAAPAPAPEPAPTPEPAPAAPAKPEDTPPAPPATPEDAPKEGDKDSATLLSVTESGDTGGSLGDWRYEPPEGVELTEADTALINKYAANAVELGIDKDKLKGLVDSYFNIAQESADANAEDYHKTINDWRDATQKDAEIFGGSKEKFEANLATAKKAIEAFASPGFMEMLEKPSAKHPNGFGLGEHPEVVRTLLRIGSALNEDSLVLGGTPAEASSGDPRADRAAALFPSMAKKSNDG